MKLNKLAYLLAFYGVLLPAIFQVNYNWCNIFFNSLSNKENEAIFQFIAYFEYSGEGRHDMSFVYVKGSFSKVKTKHKK